MMIGQLVLTSAKEVLYKLEIACHRLAVSRIKIGDVEKTWSFFLFFRDLVY